VVSTSSDATIKADNGARPATRVEPTSDELAMVGSGGTTVAAALGRTDGSGGALGAVEDGAIASGPAISAVASPSRSNPRRGTTLGDTAGAATTTAAGVGSAVAWMPFFVLDGTGWIET
jgi:hypothetical protein